MAANPKIRLPDRALVYRALAQMLQAGLPVIRALEATARTLAGPSVRTVLGEMRRQIERGDSLAESMARFPRAFPPLDIEAVRVAETSGRIDAILLELADAAELRLRMRRTILSGMLLPAGLLHLAALVIPLPLLFGAGGEAAYFRVVLGNLVWLWAIGLAVVALARSAMRSAGGRSLVDALARPVPVLGVTWRELDYWRMTSAVEMLTAAGLSVVTALRQCAPACRSPRLARALRRAADQAESAGQPVSEALAATGEFPPEMLAHWATGEESGQLDDVLRRLARLYAERSERRLQELARWAPRLAYAAVSIYLAVEILRLGAGYVHLLRSFE